MAITASLGFASLVNQEKCIILAFDPLPRFSRPRSELVARATAFGVNVILQAALASNHVFLSGSASSPQLSWKAVPSRSSSLWLRRAGGRASGGSVVRKWRQQPWAVGGNVCGRRSLGSRRWRVILTGHRGGREKGPAPRPGLESRPVVTCHAPLEPGSLGGSVVTSLGRWGGSSDAWVP